MTVCMLIIPLTACNNKDEWITDESWIEVTGSDEVQSSGTKDDKTSSGKNNTTSGKNNTGSGSTSGSKNNNNRRPQNTKADVTKAITTAYTGKDANADYNVSGKVSVCVNTNRPTDYEALFDSFQAVYKNVELEIRYFSDGDTSLNYVTKQASIGKLPDVVFDDAASVPTYVAQGLVSSLDKYVKNDPDIANVPSEILDSYRYGDAKKLYALPNSIHFSCVMINKDIVKDLNLAMPALDWTIDDMANFLKAGTTSVYSGCEMLFGNYYLAAQLCPIYDRNVGLYGYNAKTGKFDLSSMTTALILCSGLRKIEGLEAFSLRRTAGKYAEKFGNSNTSDTRMALKLGRTLVEFDSGTWEDPNLGNFKFSNTLWPYPQSEKGRMPIHVDHSFMTSATKNPDAAFQLLRYITYSTEGNMARLSMYDNEHKGNYVLSSKFYVPVTMQADVKAKFNSLGVSDVYQYMYNNIDKSYRADPTKYIPKFKEVISEIGTPVWDDVMDGKKDASAENSKLQDKLNTRIAKELKDFNEKVAKNNK